MLPYFKDVPSGLPATDSEQKLKVRFPYAAIQYFLAFSDAVLIIVASVVGSVAYQVSTHGVFGNIQTFFGTGILFAVLYVLIGRSAGFYEMTAIFSSVNVSQILTQWSLISVSLTLLAFLMKFGAEFSRGSTICFLSLALLFLLASRWWARRLIVSAVAEGRVQGRRVILVGSREELAALDLTVLLSRYGLSAVDRVTIPSNKNPLANSNEESDTLNNAVKIARECEADEIVLALPWNDSRKLELVRDRLRTSPLPVQLLPDRRIRSLAESPAFRIKKTLAIEIQRSPLSPLEQFFKRFIDIAGSLMALIVLSPLMLLVALAIKLDSAGPILFRQRRTGFNSKEFVIFKFRTMTVAKDSVAFEQAKRFDPRVTRLGRVLRRSSIDELPQLFNVLLGEMSLVGPRPHAIAHDTQYTELFDYAFRYHVKPGITGWAQVNGYRGETSHIEQMKRRVECDLWYMNNWSLGLDLKIMARTCFEVMRSTNAF